METPDKLRRNNFKVVFTVKHGYHHGVVGFLSVRYTSVRMVSVYILCRVVVHVPPSAV